MSVRQVITLTILRALTDIFILIDVDKWQNNFSKIYS